MEFDPNELAMVREEPMYIECLERSKREAVAARLRGETRPRKIVDDTMIEFYGSERGNNCDTYGKWFSNCVCARIEVDGEVSVSSENYYQRAKFAISRDDPEVVKWCREHKTTVDAQIACNETVRSQMVTMSPVAVAKYGQTIRNVPIRGDWDAVRDSVMWRALVAKFTQNADFKGALVGTGDRVLIERAPTDKYWAVNSAGLGENTLGVMLMALRGVLVE